METNETRSSEASFNGNAPRPSRRRWWALLAIPVALGALTLGAARAQGFGGGGGFRKQRMEHLLSSAGATDAQKAQIQAIWQGLRPELQPLRKQEADIRHQLGQAIAAPTIDQAKVEQLRKQSMQTVDKISAVVTRGMLASAQVLTPAQRQTVLQQIEQHRGHGPGGDHDAGE